MTSYARLSFTNDDEKLLIEFVSEHPCLWDSNCAQYSNAKIRKEFWRKIAQKLQKSETDCVRKWRFIRDYYLHKRKQKSKIYSKPNSKYQTLTFLNNVVPRQKRAHGLDYQTEFVTFEVNHANDEIESTITMESLDDPGDLYESDFDAPPVQIVDEQGKVEIITSDDLFKAPALEEQEEVAEPETHVEMFVEQEKEEAEEVVQKAELLGENDFMPSLKFLLEETETAAAAIDEESQNINELSVAQFDCVEMDGADMTEAPEISAAEILPAQSSVGDGTMSRDKVIDLFFQSMAATVKTFPANLVARAKLKVFNAISELELELHPAGE